MTSYAPQVIDRYLRASDLYNLPATAKRPARRGLLGVSRSGLWKMVSDGTFPPPIKLTPKISVWRASDVEAFMTERKGASA